MRKIISIVLVMALILTASLALMASPPGHANRPDHAGRPEHAGGSNKDDKGSDDGAGAAGGRPEQTGRPSWVIEMQEAKQAGGTMQIDEEAKAEEEERLAEFEEETGVKPYPWSKVKLRGNPFDSDTPPVIKEGRTLIPVRAITQGLGATLEWIGEESKVIIERDGIVIELFLGSNIVYVNGVEYEIDVPAMAISNRTYVPLRFLSTIFGEYVEYDEETGDIYVGNDEDEENGDSDEDSENGSEEDSDEDSEESDEE